MYVSNNDTVAALVYMANNCVTASLSQPRVNYSPCRLYCCHFSWILPEEQHCPRDVDHILLPLAYMTVAGGRVESYGDGRGLLLLISPMVVLKTDWWEWWERRGRGGGRRCLRSVSVEKKAWVIERGGDWEHLAPLRWGWMNDGMGVYCCGPGREVWEGESLFTSITLAVVEGGDSPARVCIHFSWVNLCLFVWFTSSLVTFTFHSPAGCSYSRSFHSLINSICVCISPAVSRLKWPPIIFNTGN